MVLEQCASETVAAGTPGLIQPRPIIDRLFPVAVAVQRRAQLITVGSGAVEWPVTISSITAGWAATETGYVAGLTEYATIDRALKPEQTLGIHMRATRKAIFPGTGNGTGAPPSASFPARRPMASPRPPLRRLRSTIRRAFTQGVISRNATTEGDLRLLGRKAERKESPTKAEMLGLLDVSRAVLGPGGVVRYLRPLVCMAVFTGMRHGELRALQWEDVDLGGRMVAVRPGADQFRRTGDPESRAAFRDILLAPLVVTDLEKRNLASPGRNPSPLGFIGNRGRLVQPACIQQACARLQKRLPGGDEGVGGSAGFCPRGFAPSLIPTTSAGLRRGPSPDDFW